jgi:hypothetical protein
MSREPKDKKGQEPATSGNAEKPIEVENPVTGEQSSSTVIKRDTKFLRGMWANKADPNDTDAVRLSVNGEPITWQRGVPCIVPDCYLEVAQHATFNKYSVKPGEGRKVTARITRYPFIPDAVHPTATYEEFRKEFIEGTRLTKEAVAAFGLNIPVSRTVPQLD